MKKTYLFSTLFLLAIVTHGFGQHQTKFDFFLARKQHAYATGRVNGSAMLSVFVKGNISGIQKLVKSNNGVFKYAYGNIAVIQIPVSALPQFQASNDVTRMEGNPPHMQILNDTMRVRDHIVEVQMGQSPLAQKYRGKGVVLGFIDTGIDIYHPDFRDSTGKTRIKFLWDQNQPVGPNTPTPFGYGQAWSQSQIDSAMATSDSALLHKMDSSSTILWGHGSHVTGVASGNARSNGLNMGAAPDADIIMVAFNFNSPNPNELTDAAKYIYDKATQLGEPCVINASLGDYEGSHDGKDLQAELIDSMITSQPGRCFVAAAGNAGNVPYHVGYTVTPSDTSFTWFAYDGSMVDIQVFADTGSFRNVQFAIGADKHTPDFAFRGRTAFSSIFPYLNHTIYDTVKNISGQIIGTISAYGQLTGNTYALEFVIHPDSTSYYWRFSTTGSGKFDAWDYANVVDTGLPSPALFPNIVNYKKPDTLETICSSFQCSPHVITVANYWNRGSIIDYDSVISTNPQYVPCMLAASSSNGPTRDGRIKPDIAAAGNWDLSCLPTEFRAAAIANTPQTIDEGGWHFIDGGTSTASPQVAGSAGLMFELYPLATNDEIKNMILYCADQDVCTGSSLPDNSWGYGKLDAFKAMTGCELGIINIPAAPASSLSVYPNPMRTSSIIHYNFSSMQSYCSASIGIYDVMGREVKRIALKNTKGNVSFSKGAIAGGTYFYSLMVDGKSLKTEKLIIL